MCSAYYDAGARIFKSVIAGKPQGGKMKRDEEAGEREEKQPISQ